MDILGSNIGSCLLRWPSISATFVTDEKRPCTRELAVRHPCVLGHVACFKGLADCVDPLRSLILKFEDWVGPGGSFPNDSLWVHKLVCE